MQVLTDFKCPGRTDHVRRKIGIEQHRHHGNRLASEEPLDNKTKSMSEAGTFRVLDTTVSGDVNGAIDQTIKEQDKALEGRLGICKGC